MVDPTIRPVSYFLFVHANQNLIELAKTPGANVENVLAPLLVEWCSPQMVAKNSTYFDEVLAQEYVRMLTASDLDVWQEYLGDLMTMDLDQLMATDEFAQVAQWVGIQQFQWRIGSLQNKLRDIKLQLRDSGQLAYQHEGEGSQTDMQQAVELFQQQYPALTTTMVERSLLLLTHALAHFIERNVLPEIVVLGGNRLDEHGHNVPMGGELVKAFMLFIVQQAEFQEVLETNGISTVEFETTLQQAVVTEKDIREHAGLETQLSASTLENIAFLCAYVKQKPIRAELVLVSSPEHYPRILSYISEQDSQLPERFQTLDSPPVNLGELPMRWRSLSQLLRDHANEAIGNLLGKVQPLKQKIKQVGEMRRIS